MNMYITIPPKHSLLAFVAVVSVIAQINYLAFAAEDSPGRQTTGGDASTATKIGLCLSGGGYRATLFHLGVLWALNDAGVLKNTALISASSGGAITAALTVHRWEKLKFGNDGRAKAFRDEVIKPARELTSRNLDVLSALTGLVNAPSASTSTEKAYSKHLFGDSMLADLPDPIKGEAPRVLINATELQSGTLTIMSNDLLAGPLWGTVRYPKISLAKAVAASTAWPPVLPPVFVDISQFKIEDPEGSFSISGETGDLDSADIAKLQTTIRGQLNGKLMLVDGGVLDHRAVRTCLHNPDVDIYIVSDASKASKIVKPVKDSWLEIARATVELLHDRSQKTWLDDVGPQSRYGRLITILRKNKDPETALSVWEKQIEKRPYYIALENLKEIPIWWNIKQRAWMNLVESGAVTEHPTTTFTRGEQNFLVESINEAIKLANIATRLKKVDKCTQEHIINSAYLLTIASFDLKTLARIAITNSVPKDKVSALEAFQLLPFPLHPELIRDKDKELYDKFLKRVKARPSECYGNT